MSIIDEIRDRKITVSVAGMVLLLALVIIWLQTRSATLTINHALFEGIGQVTAAETATAVHDHGQIVVVIDQSYMRSGMPHFDELQLFQRELKKHSGITLLAPLSLECELDDGTPGCPTAFKKLMEQYADVDAIVFFVSLPDWKWLQDNHWIPQRLPPQVIVVDTGPLPARGHYAGYFANGYVSMLIATRHSAPPAVPGGPRTGREWFDHYFQVFTPTNFESLTE